MTINVNDMTIGQVKELAALIGLGNAPASGLGKPPIPVGAKVFIRLVTHHYTGRVVSSTDREVVLVEASWIADDGRFMQAMAEGKFNEVEPYPVDMRVHINRDAECDWCEVAWDLPRSQK